MPLSSGRLRGYFLYKLAADSHRSLPVRTIIAAFFIFLGAALANGQEQEKKLLDRLLKPDMSLQNDAQSKQFVAGGATLTKQAPTKSFYVAERKSEKGFWNTKQVSSKEFQTNSSRDGEKAANVASRNKLTKLDAPYSTSAYAVRTSSDADRSVATSDYAGNRPFLGKGKSQKSLSKQDRPLTIDEVRELLNKNK